MVEICWTRGSYCGQILRHSVDRSTDSRWESGRFAAGWFRRLSLVRTSAICCRRWTLLDLSLHWKWGWTEYDRKTQHMLYFWKAECSRMSNMTFPCVNTIQLGPSPFNSSPQCKKSSLRYHFSRNSWKFGSQKLLHQGHFWWRGNFFFFSLPSGPRGMFEPNSHK